MTCSECALPGQTSKAHPAPHTRTRCFVRVPSRFAQYVRAEYLRLSRPRKPRYEDLAFRKAADAIPAAEPGADEIHSAWISESASSTRNPLALTAVSARFAVPLPLPATHTSPHPKHVSHLRISAPSPKPYRVVPLQYHAAKQRMQPQPSHHATPLRVPSIPVRPGLVEGERVVGKFGTTIVWEGIRYRSVLEARHAYFMKLLGVPYQYESQVFNINLSIPSTHAGRGQAFNARSFTYTPDFVLPYHRIIIEVKPKHPSLKAMQKCCWASDIAGEGWLIVLLYGDLRKGSGMVYDDNRDFRYAQGLRGIAWRNGSQLPGVVVWGKALQPVAIPDAVDPCMFTLHVLTGKTLQDEELTHNPYVNAALHQAGNVKL